MRISTYMLSASRGLGQATDATPKAKIEELRKIRDDLQEEKCEVLRSVSTDRGIFRNRNRNLLTFCEVEIDYGRE